MRVGVLHLHAFLFLCLLTYSDAFRYAANDTKAGERQLGRSPLKIFTHPLILALRSSPESVLNTSEKKSGECSQLDLSSGVF